MSCLFKMAQKGEMLPKLATLLINKLFIVLDEGEFSPQEFSRCAEQRLETALRFFRN